MSAERSICVIGGGRWGKNHVRTLSELGYLGGIADSDPERREAMAFDYPNARTFASVEEAHSSGFDGYVVATPAHTHYDVAKFLLERGCHVLVEKPITLFSEQARELCELAESSGCNLMVGHVLLFHPAIAKMRELIRAGKIGKLQYIYSNRLNLGTVRTEENILWSFAPHDISIFDYLIGTSPTSVESRGGVFLQPEIHDTTMTLLRYPDNVVAHIFLSWLHPYKEHRIVVVGSGGMLSFDDSSADKHLLFYEKGIDWVRGEPQKREGPTEVVDYDRKQPLTEELRYFAEHLDGSPVEVASGRSGVEVLEILEHATADMLGREPAQPRASVDHSGAYVHETAVVDDRVSLGDGTKIWHFSHIQSGSTIGAKTSIGQNVYVGADVEIGKGCKIQNNVSVYAGVQLEDYVFCGPSMVFTNVLNPRSKYPRQSASDYSTTLVKEGASLGANSTIVCGTSIGRHAFVAAGAVVTGDVPDYALMMGVPARRVGWMCECGERLDDELTCTKCERRYRDDGEALAEVER